jgi:hypothetical protein
MRPNGANAPPGASSASSINFRFLYLVSFTFNVVKESQEFQVKRHIAHNIGTPVKVRSVMIAFKV